MSEAPPRGTIQAPPLGYEAAIALAGECFLWRCRQGLEFVIPSRWSRRLEEADRLWGKRDSQLFLVWFLEEALAEMGPALDQWRRDDEIRRMLRWPPSSLAYRLTASFEP